MDFVIVKRNMLTEISYFNRKNNPKNETIAGNSFTVYEIVLLANSIYVKMTHFFLIIIF